MAQLTTLKCKGLYTHPNELGTVPEGSLLRAVNCVIDREDVLENMRGSKRYGIELSDYATAMFPYRDRLIAHAGTELSYDSDGAGTWVDYTGSFSAPTGRKMRAFESNQNCYFTTTLGIRKIDALTGTSAAAGIPKALDGTAALNGAAGFLATANQVAYRIVWGKKDANENLVLGAPSQRIAVANGTGGNRNVSLDFTIPDGITVSHIYQVYRSQASGSATISANDEMQLAYEGSPTAGQITAKVVTLIDVTVDSLLGTTLYTSPSQQGIAMSNDEPPFAVDACIFRNHALYVNTQTVQQLSLSLIGTGAPGLVADDTIVIDGVTFTAKAAESIANKEFKLFSGGTPADDIEDTAMSLIMIINRASGVNVYAYYMSGYNDLPGKILLKDRTFGGTAWAVTSSKGASFSPILPTSGTTVSSSNEAKKNRVYIAKEGEPEAVPYGQYLDAGSADKDIYRVIALRDSVFILKEDGVFRLTGTGVEDFQVSLFDNTAILVGIETAAPLNNQVFAYSTQGVVAISDTGVQVVSRAVETDLTTLSSDLYPNFETMAFAVAYETERKYILWVPTAPTDTVPTQAYVYNSFTNAWTTWDLSRGAAVINPYDDRLYTADTAEKYIRQNRKDFVLSDYAEDEYALTIASASGTTVTVNDTSDAVVGQTLYADGNGSQAIVLEITDGAHLEVDREITWEAGAAKLYDPYSVDVIWAPLHGGSPGLLKQFSEVVFFFKHAVFAAINVIFGSNFSVSGRLTELSPKTLGNEFGDGAFDDGEFGVAASDLQPIRTYVPLEQQRGHWLNITLQHNEACSHFALNGMAIVMTPMDTRFR